MTVKARKAAQVRVERLNDISEADALAEGIARGIDGWWGSDPDPAARDEEPTPLDAFTALWMRINGQASYDANPWVLAYTFRVVKANIDSEEAKAA